jgi:hypothetical protein
MMQSQAIELFQSSGAKDLSVLKAQAIELVRGPAGELQPTGKCSCCCCDLLKQKGCKEEDKKDKKEKSAWEKYTEAAKAAKDIVDVLTKRAEELNKTLSKVEELSGLGEKELRKMVFDLSDYTYSADELVKAMESMAQKGVSTKEDFETLIPVFHTVAKATDKKMNIAFQEVEAVLSSLRIPLMEAEEHLDTFTYLATQTGVSLKSVSDAIKTEQQAVLELGLSLDDVALAMAALDAEGTSGMQAVQAFQSAVQAADGDLSAFWQSLGVTTESIAAQSEALRESEGLTQQLAETNQNSMSIWAKLKNQYDLAMWGLGSILTPAKTVLTAITDLNKVVTSARKIFQLFNLTLLKNPLFWIIGLVTLLGVAFYQLWQKKEEVIQYLTMAWDRISTLIGTSITNISNRLTLWFQNMVQWFSDTWDQIKAYFQGHFQSMLNLFQTSLSFITNLWNNTWSSVQQFFGNIINSVVGSVSGLWQRFSQIFSNLASNAVTWGKSIIQGLINGITGRFTDLVDTAKMIGSKIGGAVKSFFGINSPARLMIDYGGSIAQGLQLGMEREEPQLPLPDVKPFSDLALHSRPARAHIEAPFAPQIKIDVQGQADVQQIKRELEYYLPQFMESYFHKLANKMAGVV